MKKSVFPCVQWVVLLSLLSFTGCYAKVEVSDSSAEKAIAIDWVEPPCAEPGSDAGYIEGNGFGAENVTVTVGGIEAEVLAATGKDASFVVPEGLEPGQSIEVVVMNPGGRLATIQWVACGFDCSGIDCDDGNECTADTCDPVMEMCVHTPVGDGATCDFNPGAGDGVCQTGTCVLSGGPDVDPPVLADFDFTPKTVDVTLAPADVTCSATVTDSPAGVDTVICYFDSPTTTQRQTCIASSPTSGDVFDGVWSCTATIPQGAEAGAWTVFRVFAEDTVGNQHNYSTAELQSLGFPTLLDVISLGGDTDPPVLADFDFTPKTVDVTLAPADVTCSATVTDSPAGVDTVICYFDSPTTTQRQTCIASSPTSGDVFDGVWSCTATIPQGAEAGAWTVFRVFAEDTVGNQHNYSTAELQSLGFPTLLDVISLGGDTDPPVLTDFDFTPKTVDVTLAPADVTCSATVTDSPAGVDTVICYFDSPTTTQRQTCIASSPTSGDVFDGVWSCTATIPQGAEAGAWTVFRVFAEDTVGNQHNYSTAELQSLGFPTQLDVTYGSGPDTDPPELVDFDFNPKSVDVSTGSQDVTCTMSFVDSGLGTDRASCSLWSPTTGLTRNCNALGPSSGDAFDGTFTCTVTIESGVEAGTWTVGAVDAHDEVGNRSLYFAPDLEALGFPTLLDVTSTSSDTDPPELVDFDFNPKSVDVSTGSQDVTCTMSFVDSGLGTDRASCSLWSPTTGLTRNCNALGPSSGDAFDGTFTCTVTIESGVEAGTWTVGAVDAHDEVGNRSLYFAPDLEALGFPTLLDVTSTSSDTDPPELVDFDFNPKSVDVSTGSQDVTCTMSFVDSGLGTDRASCSLWSPTTGLTRNCNALGPSSGDAFDGTFTCTVTIESGVEAGTWTVGAVDAHDEVGNRSLYFAPDLEALGFPTQLAVNYGGGSPP